MSKKPPIPFYVARKTVSKLFDLMFDVRVEGLENIPQDQQFILISNHLNWSDPFFLYKIFPAKQNLVFVAEYDGIYDKWWNKAFIDSMGKPILPIHRDDPNSRVKTIKGMYSVIKGGKTLAIFPEGRIGHQEGDLFPFHVGAFSVARKLKVPILPVALAGTKELSYKKPIHIRIGELAQCGAEETDEDFARRMALTVKDLIPAYPGDGPSPHKLNWMTGLCQGELRPFEGERDLIVRVRKEKGA